MCIFGDQCSLKHTRRNNIRTCFHFIFSLYFFVMSFLSRFSFHFQQFPWLLSVAFYLSSPPHPNTRGGTLVLVSACCVNEAFCYLNSTQTLKANLVCAPNRTPAMYFHEWHQHPPVPGTRRPEGVCVWSAGCLLRVPFVPSVLISPLDQTLVGPTLISQISPKPTQPSHLSITICLNEIVGIHLMRPFSSRSPGVLLPLDLHPSPPLWISSCPSRSLVQQSSPFLPPSSAFFSLGAHKHCHSKCCRYFSHLNRKSSPWSPGSSMVMLTLCLYH